MTKRIWVRMGAAGDYHDFDDPYEAGYEIGDMYAEMGYDLRGILHTNRRWRNKGYEFAEFSADNYVSLFWGDADAQPIDTGELSGGERQEFEDGMYDGANIAGDIRESA